jgi:hypothetical protein
MRNLCVELGTEEWVILYGVEDIGDAVYKPVDGKWCAW